MNCLFLVCGKRVMLVLGLLLHRRGVLRILYTIVGRMSVKFSVE
jgi:hypothetical protein